MAERTAASRRDGARSLRRWAQDADLHVGARLRERRIALGLTQQQLAELIGVTYQQAHKYETVSNRISAGRLYQLAQALGVDTNYFFDGLGGEYTFKPTPQMRWLLELTRHFVSIPSRHVAWELATIEPTDEENQQHAAAVVLAERRGRTWSKPRGCAP